MVLQYRVLLQVDKYYYITMKIHGGGHKPSNGRKQIKENVTFDS
jgi:hypothetical protein